MAVVFLLLALAAFACAVLAWRRQESLGVLHAAPKVFVLIGGVMFVLFLVILVNMPSEQQRIAADAQATMAASPDPSAMATPEASPTPDIHAARATARKWWDSEVGWAAFADVMLQYSVQSLGQGDSVESLKLVRDAKGMIAKAKDANLSPPDSWNDVSDKLDQALNAYDDGLSKIEAAFDSDTTSNLADASDDTDTANSAFSAATDAAQQKYRDMGGDPSALDTIEHDAKSLRSSFDELLQSANSQ